MLEAVYLLTRVYGGLCCIVEGEMPSVQVGGYLVVGLGLLGD